MDTTQLDLFQDENDYERNIFLSAKKLKKIAQDLFKNSIRIFPKESNNDDFAIIRVEIKFSQISDDLASPPNTPKIFIWKFIPIVTLEINKKSVIEFHKDPAYNKFMGPKIIPKWVNEMFTMENFTPLQFLNFMAQGFTLDIANFLFQDEVVKKIESKINGKKLIIYIEGKLFAFPKLNTHIVNLLNLFDSNFNKFTKIKNRQFNNWYFAARYDDFSSDDDLIKCLDECIIFNKHRNKDKSLKYASTLKQLFNNDLLFLNNCEFFHEIEKYDIQGWDADYLFTPDILENEYENINVSLFKKNIRTLCYYYKKQGEHFHRFELLLPNINHDISELRNIIKVVQTLHREK